MNEKKSREWVNESIVWSTYQQIVTVVEFFFFAHEVIDKEEEERDREKEREKKEKYNNCLLFFSILIYEFIISIIDTTMGICFVWYTNEGLVKCWWIKGQVY